MKSIAYFVTPHGFGHATRASAVMAALQCRHPDLCCEIFTQAPRWLFAESLPGPFCYHEIYSDVGLAQFDALNVDLESTLARLNQLIPFAPALIEDLSKRVQQAGCEMIFCDIAPLGIAVAQRVGIPSVVVENFTWDWIYEGYVHLSPRLRPYVDWMAEQFAATSIHIQTEPVCRRGPAWWPTDLTVAPVARALRTPAHEIRQHLAIPNGVSLILVTMGGMDWRHSRLDRLEEMAPVHFLFTGGDTQGEIPHNVHFLGRDSGFYHPDLVAASDAVVGKLGYSTVAEVYHAGIPYGYIPRAHFRESAVLADFIHARMGGLPIAEEQFTDGSWVDSIPALLALRPHPRQPINGADQIAAFVSN
ncbi:MAG: hypothetical protein KF893_18755 [Caldilineaceae bacterium]|nr:hypothetical protein [Caldilineaceae bacterium]